MTKRNIIYLLKRSAKLGVKRKPAKTYQLCLKTCKEIQKRERKRNSNKNICKKEILKISYPTP